MTSEFDRARARAEAGHVQRERQQGLGKPIISVDFNGRRLVAVRNRLLHSQQWLTFEDFLFDYIKIAIGSEWGNAEIAKPLGERHPILFWYHKICEFQHTFITKPGKVRSASMLGLGGHLKTGQTWPLQNRPTKLSQNKSIYNPPMAVSANLFS